MTYAIHARANGQEVWFNIPGHTPELAICNAAMYLRDTYGADGEYAILSPIEEVETIPSPLPQSVAAR